MNKHTPARTADEIISAMCKEMPFPLPESRIPYIKEAMQIYAKEQNTELLEALIEYVNLEQGHLSKLTTTPAQRLENGIAAIKKATE